MALFLHVLGPRFLDTFNGFIFQSDADKHDITKVIEKFDRYVIGEINESYERYIFNKRNQNVNEKFDDYLASLRMLAETCSFCECLKKSLIRDRIIAGILNPNTRKKLLQERNLSLNKCIDVCRSAETTHRQLKGFQAENEASIHALKNEKRKSKFPSRGKQTKPDTVETKTCLFCGNVHKMLKSECPAYGKKCTACGGKNHFSKVCKTKQKNKIQAVDHLENDTDSDYYYEYESDSETEYISIVQSGTAPINSVIANDINAEMIILPNTKVTFQVDSGARVNTLPAKLIPEALKSEMVNKKSNLCMWNGDTCKSPGSIRLKIRNPKNDKKYSVLFTVVDADFYTTAREYS